MTAVVTAPHRVDADVEKIVGRLSLEPTVSAARWQAELHLDPEHGHPLDLGTLSPRPDRPAG